MSIHDELRCIYCGSGSTNTRVDRVKPDYKMEHVHFSCGTIQTQIFSDRRRIGEFFHEGCQIAAQACKPDNSRANT